MPTAIIAFTNKNRKTHSQGLITYENQKLFTGQALKIIEEGQLSSSSLTEKSKLNWLKTTIFVLIKGVNCANRRSANY
jgi:hypothetical protein